MAVGDVNIDVPATEISELYVGFIVTDGEDPFTTACISVIVIASVA